jgi:hypothetical protein
MLRVSPFCGMSSSSGLRDLESEFGCVLSEQLDLLVAVSLLVVLSPFVKVSSLSQLWGEPCFLRLPNNLKLECTQSRSKGFKSIP